MSGPEHYDEAERLLTEAAGALGALVGSPAEKADAALTTAPVLANLLAKAQVHATLALTAAVNADRAIGPVDSSGWRAIEVES